MRPKTLQNKLLLGVIALVLSSGLLISLLVTHRYGRSLSDALVAQARYLSDAVALQAVDLVLTNDLVALQKMLDQQVSSNPLLSYLFVVREGQVLAHTFKDGMPPDLVSANTLSAGAKAHSEQIVSDRGEHYLDLALPILEGNAGVLRLGFSEEPHRRQVSMLRLQMATLTGLVLLMAVGGALLFVRQITGPLTKLSKVVDRVERGEIEARVELRGEDEVAVLGASFNSMLDRLQSYTERLEEQAMELERANHQTRTFCGIVQEIGALQTLKEIGGYLVGRFRPILECGPLAFLLINDTRDALFIVNERQATHLKEPGPVQNFSAILDDLNAREDPDSTDGSGLITPFVSEVLQMGAIHSTIPLVHDKRTFGVLVIACGYECRCGEEEIRLVESMLYQAAGVIRRAVLQEEEIRELQSRVTNPTEFCGIVSKNHKMQAIFQLIENIAPTDATVLIQGDSGTGKELVARAIHHLSTRKEKPFIVIDCSAYPATLLESELFGHEKGAFTGAVRQKSGRFEQAEGGTVFLDEIGEVPLPAQIKLLRVLQTHKFERLGGEQTLTVDVRVIAATNRNLLDEVKNGQFREDLYYRLNVIPVHVPPLRQRRNDIPLLARHFHNRFARAENQKVEGISLEAMRLLLDYPWPGNVRELENSIEHAVVLAKGKRIEPAHLPAVLHKEFSSPVSSKPPTISEQEVRLLREAMEECGWNKKEAAKRLGISRSTLYEKLKKHRITRPTTH